MQRYILNLEDEFSFYIAYFSTPLDLISTA